MAASTYGARPDVLTFAVIAAAEVIAIEVVAVAPQPDVLALAVIAAAEVIAIEVVAVTPHPHVLTFAEAPVANGTVAFAA